MIRKVTADRSSFKTLEFHSGLNILLADRSESATDKDSRNGAGKTSLLELIHFVFGASASGTIFRSADIGDWRFGVEMEVDSEPGSVMRSGRRADVVEVSGFLVPDDHEEPPRLMGAAPHAAVPIGQWKAGLGERWFGLGQEDEAADRFGPRFRALFSYFARRQAKGAFKNPMQYWSRQPVWEECVSISWLLGLDWTVAQRLQHLREREKGVVDAMKAIESSELPVLSRTASELRTALTVARGEAHTRKQRLHAFRVLPDYEDLEKEADSITGEINDIAGDNIADRALLRELETSLGGETDDMHPEIHRLYKEAGIVLPGVTLRRLADVDIFHRAVVRNRKSHLKDAIESARERIAERERRKESLDRRRREIMKILESGGALAEYSALREEVARREGEVEVLEQHLRNAEEIEGSRAALKVERASLLKAVQDDLTERGERLQEVILRFEQLSQSLYERAGRLHIAPSNSGPKFEVQIPSGRSLGITNMQIFCFDLMLMDLMAERGRSPGFLIHDSHLFDGVDERQVARALQVGAQRAEAGGFQYIVTLNSDAIPREGFDPGFRLDDYFLDVRLTDARPDGGLFGIRFD